VRNDVHHPGGATDQLVIPLHVPRWGRLSWPVLSSILGFGSVVWIVLSPSWPSILYGGLMIASLVWVWATRVAARRARGDQPPQIIATRTGISSPVWAITWDRVSRVWIGPIAGGGIQALHIETFRPEDVRWAKSKTVRLNARASRSARMAPIQIPQVNVDRPLSAIAADFERLAGRALDE
jgi:hypothetical protein